VSAYDNRAREAVDGIIAQSSSAIPQLLALLRAAGTALAERIGDERTYVQFTKEGGEYLKRHRLRSRSRPGLGALR
jgi:hypothetical protein